MEKKEIKEEKQKNKNGPLIAIIIVMALVIVGLVGYICYDNGIIFENKKEEVSEKSEVLEDEKVVEKEISDIAIKRSFGEKIDVLIHQYYNLNEYSDLTVYSTHGFRYNVLNSQMTDDMKLGITLNTVDKQFSKLTVEYEKIDQDIKNKFKPIPADYTAEEYFNTFFTQIDVSKVNAQYMDLFGSEISSYNNVGKCPFYTYDKSNHVYYRAAECGGTSGSAVLMEKTKYIEKGDNVYVYVKFATVTPKELGDGNFSYDYSDIRAGLFENTTSEEFSNIPIYKSDIKNDSLNNFKLSDYEDAGFPEYKFSFKKNNDTGKYYFVSVEKTN